MYPIIARMGPITIYSFGLMMALAFLVGGYIVSKELGRKGLDPNLSSPIFFAAAVGGLVGARLLVIIDEFKEFIQAPLSFLLTGAGFVWYGGLLGGLVGVSWVIYRRGLPWLVTADCVAAALPLGHAIGRIGCHLAGDGDWGTETALPWGVAYEDAIIGWDYPAGVRVHPTPLYEAALYTVIFAILWWTRRRMRTPGVMLGLYFILSGTVRLLVEFVRIEPRVLWGLTQAQLFSVVLLIAGVGLIGARPKKS
jgi:phosphatidylglycerol:prolipoprotein diacylglycerol transferase